MKVSLFCSSIRPHLWKAFFESLKGTTVPVEVVFAGNLDGLQIQSGMEDIDLVMLRDISMKYVPTRNIKPAQVYEVARRTCTGDLICWVADDCEFHKDVIGKAARFWEQKCTRKDIVCLATMENYGMWRECGANSHHFFGETPEAPKMAPIGMMNREYFQELGGIDRRYICGQWDNDLMMRLYNDGGKLYFFGDEVVELDHYRKHIEGMKQRPFAKGFDHDRNILEGSWGRKGQMIYKIPYTRFDKGFEPFEDANLTEVSQSFNIKELFND